GLAHTVTQRIANSAPEFVFSYARQNKEGEQRPSPLLARIFGTNYKTLSTHDLRAQLHGEEPALLAQELERLYQSSEIAHWPQDRAAGGASILKEQAACPFQAFATRRLQAKPLNRAEWGLSAMDRGNLIHRILENIWSPKTPETFRMTGLEDLKQVMAAQRLDEVLRYHISHAFAGLMKENAGDAWMTSYLESEQQRLLVRLREWMQCEAERLPFEVERREEELKDVHVGGLKLNLRADRIDLLPDGSRLLIDYKTGDVSAADWQGERMKEPQLPLYAIYGNVENVSGLLFARIRAGKTEFAGHVANAQAQFEAGLTAKSPLVNKPYNIKMREGWQRALLGLAEEFLRGEASVDPKEGPKTCKYCPLPGLCRIAELDLATDGEEPDDE
ncbi:MAG TPA: PD-(D/E)XK nuclease family protein, partial [Pseudacidobacterium sp.]|nr:PD-(D/E)XK nuclease family protein [Pseudacidobacterium sp.]